MPRTGVTITCNGITCTCKGIGCEDIECNGGTCSTSGNMATRIVVQKSWKSGALQREICRGEKDEVVHKSLRMTNATPLFAMCGAFLIILACLFFCYRRCCGRRNPAPSTMITYRQGVPRQTKNYASTAPPPSYNNFITPSAPSNYTFDSRMETTRLPYAGEYFNVSLLKKYFEPNYLKTKAIPVEIECADHRSGH